MGSVLGMDGFDLGWLDLRVRVSVMVLLETNGELEMMMVDGWV